MKRYVFKVKSVKRIDRELGRNKIFKKCSKCGELKFINYFKMAKKIDRKRFSSCKECEKKYREDNKEKIKEKRMEYYHNNKEKVYERQKKYREDNKEKIRKQKKQYREENKEKIQKYYKNYEEENKKRLEKYRKKYREEKVKNAMQKIKTNFTERVYNTDKTQYGVIYKITCKNGRVYIGQTVRSFDLRYPQGFFYDKIKDLKTDTETKQSLIDDYNQYGEEGFTIDKCIDVAFSPEELDKLEVYYIDKYKAYDEGYNSNRGYINGRTTLYKKWEEENN